MSINSSTSPNPFAANGISFIHFFYFELISLYVILLLTRCIPFCFISNYCVAGTFTSSTPRRPKLRLKRTLR
jgi:hypothetical protein